MLNLIEEEEEEEEIAQNPSSFLETVPSMNLVGPSDVDDQLYKELYGAKT